MLCSKCNSVINTSKRSLRQNAFLHLVIGMLADHTGYSHSEMKQLLKDEFGLYSVAINKKTGEEFRVYKSTAKLNKTEFAEFTEKILLLANGSYGMNILTPEEFFNNAT